MSVLICFALKEEAAPFRKLAAGKPGLDLLLVGIGRQNAENSLRRRLTGPAPDLVFTCGFAGGLHPGLKVGDVIFELPGIETPPSLRGLRERLLAANARPGKFFCADRIATTVAEKQKLRTETGADAVEMESAAIHAVCRERGIPCATVRAISDPADEDLPLDFNTLAKPDHSLDFGRLAWAIVRSPGKIGGLLALQRKSSRAARQLAAVLRQITSP